MPTTENTLPYGTYANATTPLWASAQSGQQFVSPSAVVNQLVPPTAEITTIVNDNASEGAFTLNTIPEGTPLNEIRLGGLVNGVSVYTNGEPTFITAPDYTGVIGDFQVVSRQTGGTWGFNNNELSYNNVKQLTGDTQYTQLGENTYSDIYGLNVWNVNSSNKTSTVSDREIYFTTTTPGTVTTNTYDFASPLVPNQTTANSLIRNPNSRTPIFYNDIQFEPTNVAGAVVVSPTTPYIVTVQNTLGVSAFLGVKMVVSYPPDVFIKASEFPLWFEFIAFDPGVNNFSFINQGAGFGQTSIITNYKNTAGVLSFETIGGSTPTTFVVGDYITVIYEWIDKSLGTAQVRVAKNNVFISSSPTGLLPASDVMPVFTSVNAVAPGYTFSIQLNWGNTSPIIASFDGWEWTAGLGGLYPRNNTALAPASSGSNPPGFLYNSVFLLGGCFMTSPPISTDQGQTITISAYKGSKLGTGTLSIFQNTVNLIFSGVVTNAWTSGAITTAVSTGSDTFTFVYTSSTDVLSLQRIQISFNTPVDVLDGGMGMNGTVLNIGAGNYYSLPTISMTSSNINITKPINMGTNTISNASFSGTFVGNLSGNINTNLIAPISPATSTQVGNLNLSNSSISNVGTLAVNSITGNGVGTISVGSAVTMSAQQNISNVGTLSSVYISNSSNISTPALNSTGSTLDVGLISPINNFWNVNTITGRGSNFPALITMVDTINQVSAIPTGIIYIQTNFDGFKEVAIPLIPTWNRSDTLCYRLSNPNYLSTTGYTLSGKSELIIRDASTLAILEQHTNTGDTPLYFGGSAMVLNTTSILYTYRVNLNAL
jgi:hypothetical protein